MLSTMPTGVVTVNTSALGLRVNNEPTSQLCLDQNINSFAAVSQFNGACVVELYPSNLNP